jgi:hypothetical protein
MIKGNNGLNKLIFANLLKKSSSGPKIKPGLIIENFFKFFSMYLSAPNLLLEYNEFSNLLTPSAETCIKVFLFNFILFTIRLTKS